MTRYIAFLRAINIGGHTVKMNALRALCEGLGLAEVETFIASGNLAFTIQGKAAAALECEIEAHLERALGYAVATFIRTPEELRAVVGLAPFGPGVPQSGHTLFVSFLKAPPSAAAAQRALALASDVDRLHIAGRELYWLRQGGYDSTKLSGASFERALRAPATARNINTLSRLVAKFA